MTRSDTPAPSEPMFSVIIPTYNRTKSLVPAVQSVLDQSLPPDEVIVVDDGSQEDVAAALAPFGDRVTLLRQPNGGASKARNTGAAHARGRWLTFQDSDDLWTPDHLASVARDVTNPDLSDPDASDLSAPLVAHIGNVVYVGPGYREDLFAIKGQEYPMGTARVLDDPLPLVISGMSLQGAAIRRDIYQALGGLDVTMPYLEDTAFFCQLALEGRFAVTGDMMAEIIRLPGDSDALTQIGHKDRVAACQMHLRVFDTLPDARLSPAQRPQVARLRSGAGFRLAEALMTSDRRAARHQLIAAARCHPRPLVGWGKSLIGLVFGSAGMRWILGRNTPLDRS